MLHKRTSWSVRVNAIYRHVCTAAAKRHQQLIRKREQKKSEREKEAQSFLKSLDEVTEEKAKSIDLEYTDYFYFHVPHLDKEFKPLSAAEIKRLITDGASESERLSYYEYCVSKAELKTLKKEPLRLPTNEVYKYMLQPYRNISLFTRHQAVYGFLYGHPVVIDLDYPRPPKYRKIVSFEIGQCYKNNTNHLQPSQLHFSGLKNDPYVKEEFSEGGILEHLFVHQHDECFMDIFSQDKLVYLTPNAPPLKEYDGNKVYVIGGLMDKDNNSESLSKAKRCGIAYGSLPLDRYIRCRDGWAKKTLSIHRVLGLLLDMNLSHQWKFSIKKNVSLFSYLPPQEIAKLESISSEKDKQEFLWRVYNSP